MARDPILIGIPEIADIAKVSRPAVSNWRKRYDDFPEPRIQSDSGLLFDLADIENWLLARGKIDRPISPGSLVWRFADALRGSWQSETLFEFTSSWLCYLEACERVESPRANQGSRTSPRIEVDTKNLWSAIRHAADKDLPARLAKAATQIEADNPRLVDLFTYLAPEPFPSAQLARAFVTGLEAATDDVTPRFALFEEAKDNAIELSRSAAEISTPGAVAVLVHELLGKIPDGSTVVDPACGTGGLLLMAAVGDNAPDGPARFLGVDNNATATRHARARFFLGGIDVDIDTDHSFQRAATLNWPRADIVVCDPPYGMSNWGDADLYRSPIWKYGPPSPNSSDFAWVQLCLSMLNPGGRAAVILPPGPCFRGGREGEIRKALLDDGVVEAVIHLPPRLRRDTGIPLTIWLLRAPGVAPPPVLLVDATALGTAGRSTHELEQEDIDSLRRLVDGWRQNRTLDAGAGILAYSIDRAELLAAGAELMPGRYAPAKNEPPLEQLHLGYEIARDQLGDLANELAKTLGSLGEQRSTDRIKGSIVRLGDIAEILKPRAAKQGDDAPLACAGDILLTASSGGLRGQMLDEGDPIQGLHATVIRSQDPSRVRPSWLRLWTQTPAFGDLIDRHAKGTTIRSISARDLADFELRLPPLAMQEEAETALERIDDALESLAAVAKSINEQRDAVLSLLYARVTE